MKSKGTDRLSRPGLGGGRVGGGGGYNLLRGSILWEGDFFCLLVPYQILN